LTYLQARYARIDALEAKYSKKILRVLLRQLEQCVELVKAGASAELVVAQINGNAMKIVLTELYLKVIQSEAKYEYLHLVNLEKKAVLPVSDWLRRARNFIAIESSKAITQITATTRSQVKKVLKEAAVAGSSIQETAKSLRTTIAGASRKRAITIARTELIGSMNAGAYTGALSTGLKLNKVWLATSDKRTRDTHREADGQRVDINQAFNVGGDSAAYPGDPALSAAERIRCRCSVVFKKKPTPTQGILDL
jgi:uncharacterized protein with gpF-like domain